MRMCAVATTPPFDAHAHLLDAMKVAAAVLTASAGKLQVFLLTTLVKAVETPLDLPLNKPLA